MNSLAFIAVLLSAELTLRYHLRDGSILPDFAMRFISLTLVILFLTACQSSNLRTDSTFPIVVGASDKSDIRPCSDYGSDWTPAGKSRAAYAGQPRHTGMDFCAPQGTEVISSADGEIVNIVWENPRRGGRVTIETNIQYTKKGLRFPVNLHLDFLHIKPKKGLAVGQTVKVGDVVGHLEPPGAPEIGQLSHVHLSAGPNFNTWSSHTDPNRFWQKGPGIVSCFNPKDPPHDKEIVAPIKC